MAVEDRTDRMTFDQLRETGILWAINKMIMHPRGFALALDYDDPWTDGNPADGWLICGDGSEAWEFEEKTDNDGFRKFQKFMNTLVKSPVAKEEND